VQERVARPPRGRRRAGRRRWREARTSITRLDEATAIHAGHLGAVDAPRVVLLHGIGAGAEVVAPIAAALADRCAVVAPDLPGFGRSTGHPDATDPRSLAAALARWVEARQLGPAAFLGVSAGCQVLTRLAVTAPHLVDRLVLQGPTVARGARAAPSQLARLALDAVLEHPGLWFVQARGVVRLGLRRLVRVADDLLDDRPESVLPRIGCPVLVVRGGWDPLVPASWSEQVARLAPHGRLAVVPRAPHALVYSRPRQLARVTVPFLTPSR
jgi:pimeloyl-ACP methyl ester carboxylesterase